MEGDTPAQSASADNASSDTSKNPANLSIGTVVNISSESITSRNRGGGGEATISKLHHDPTTGAVCKVDVKFVISARTQKNVDVAYLSLHQEELPKRRSRRSSAAAGDASKENQSKKNKEMGEKATAGNTRKKAVSAKKKRNVDSEVEKKQTPKKEIDSNETDEDKDWILITGSEGNFSYYERLLQPPTRVLFWWDDDLGWIKGRVTKGLSKKLTKYSIKWLVSIFFEHDGEIETLDFFPKGLKRWKVFKEDVEEVMKEVHESEDGKLKGPGKVSAKTPSKSTKSSQTEKQSTKVSSGGNKTKQAAKASDSSSKKAPKSSASSPIPIQRAARSTTSNVGKANATKPETSRFTSSTKEKLGESAQESGPTSVTKTSARASTTVTVGSRSSFDANDTSQTQQSPPISKITTSHGNVEMMTASEDVSTKMVISADECASKTSSTKPSYRAFGTSQARSGVASDEKENKSDTTSPKQDKVRETGGQKKRKPLGSLDPNSMSKSKKLKTEKIGIHHANTGYIPPKPKEATPLTSTKRSSEMHAAQRRVSKEQQADLRGINKGYDIKKLSQDGSGSKSTLTKFSAPKVASLKSSTSNKPSPAQVSQSPSLQKSAPPVKSVGMRKSISLVAENIKATKPRKTSCSGTTTTQTLIGKEREKADKLVGDVVGSQSKSRSARKGSEDDSSSLHSSSGSSYSSTLELKFSTEDQEVMNTFVNTILNTRDEIQVEELVQLLHSDRGVKKTSGKPFSTKEIEAHLERLDNESKIFLSKSEGSKGTIYKS
mmetsp:Transcript_26647/g.55647  ORF Transcript_26647/g.55647 Transcript_26647/m.55647 type:complete len:776 (+) Transcript_26647:108-2435(+)